MLYVKGARLRKDHQLLRKKKKKKNLKIDVTDVILFRDIDNVSRKLNELLRSLE